MPKQNVARCFYNLGNMFLNQNNLEKLKIVLKVCCWLF
jgi:hypothetical protein